MKIYFAFTRSYAISLCVILLVAFSVLSIAGNNKNDIVLESEAQRAAFINQNGFIANDPISVKSIIVPLSRDKNYDNFYKAYASCGYDLSDYMGKALTEYTYLLKGNFTVHILMDNNKLVGADYCDLFSQTVVPIGR